MNENQGNRQQRSERKHKYRIALSLKQRELCEGKEAVKKGKNLHYTI